MRTYSALIPFVTLALTIAANAAPTAPFTNGGAYTQTAGGFDGHSLVVRHGPSSSSDAVPLPTSTGAASVPSGASLSTNSGGYTPPTGWNGPWPPPQGPPPPGEPPAIPRALLSSRDTHPTPPPNGGAPQLEEKPHHDIVLPHPEQKNEGLNLHPGVQDHHTGAPNANPAGKMAAVKGKFGKIIQHPKVKKIAKYAGFAAAGAAAGSLVTAGGLMWAGGKGSSGSSGTASEGSGAPSTTGNVDDTASIAGSETSGEGDTGSDTSASSTDTSSPPAKRAVARSMYHRRVSRWDLD
ncbi:hypothetical protein F5050DRAFT_1811050 [Lentinula boryana]|uniref:Uncharacterized protein n=1 Tax=Lentinula boryana TaxID=40481 RepID=A0ABQ8Q4T3_9AGAR|nr:hypothetical protein F5050DRAFT_1811050 [Lentinula boryana]